MRRVFQFRTRGPGCAIFAAMFVALVGCARGSESARQPGPPAPVREDATHRGAMAALLVRSGIRTSMLAGDGTAVRDFIGNVRDHADGVEIRVFSNEGEAIYVDEGPAPERSQWPEAFAAVHDQSEARLRGHLRWTSPLLHAKDCERCHEPRRLRGVLDLSLAASHEKVSSEGLALGLGEIINATFRHMMTIGAVEQLGEYYESMAEAVPGVENCAVFSRDGEPTIGDAFMEVPDSIRQRSLTSKRAFVEELDGHAYLGVPLRNDASCRSCHEGESEVRGAIVAHLAKDELEQLSSATAVVDHSLHHVMMTGRERLIHRFLRDTAQSSWIDAVALYDGEGRTFFDSSIVPEPPPQVRAVLDRGTSRPNVVVSATEITHVLPLVSEAKCQRCHFDGKPLRGALQVRIARDTAAADRGAEGPGSSRH